MGHLSAAIAAQRSHARVKTPSIPTVAPDTDDDEVGVGLAERLPWDDGSIDLVVTSPPYSLGEKVAYADGGDHDDYPAYLELVQLCARELFRRSRRLCLDVPIKTDRGGWRPVAHHWQTSLEAAGWQYRTTIVWNKGRAGSGTDRGRRDSAATPNVTAPVELVLAYFRGTWFRSAETTDRQSDLSHSEWLEWCGPRGVWDFPGEHNADHPAVSPDELARRCIKLFSFVGDVVGDPFCGRGTTARVSARMERRIRAVDRSPLYVARAQTEIISAVAPGWQKAGAPHERRPYAGGRARAVGKSGRQAIGISGSYVASMPSKAPTTLRPKQGADALAVDEKTVRNWIRAGVEATRTTAGHYQLAPNAVPALQKLAKDMPLNTRTLRVRKLDRARAPIGVPRPIRVPIGVPVARSLAYLIALI